jgi:katanin p60 ATPase-containing subunit A1
MQTLHNKLDYDAKMTREKRENERRKNILILILRYLINVGLSETAFHLQEESNLDIDKFDAADNIDLGIIFAEYEEYFEIKFNKKPIFVKKITEKFEKNTINKLPSINNRKETPKLNSEKNKNNKTLDKNQQNNNNNNTNQGNKDKDKGELKLELVGQNMNINKKEKEEKEKFSFNDQKESILLKPIPENLFGNSELKELASMVKK